MIAFDDVEIRAELKERLEQFLQQVEQFRDEGPLDDVSLMKLEEYFKSSHIYHSAGIEGNRLTLQETALVLNEGIDISGKPLSDTVEVKNLGSAFEYLKELAKSNQSLRETDIRNLHSLLIGKALNLSPGEYRKVGVIISGSEHRPPEPLEVPMRMEALVNWFNENGERNPIIVAAIVHHELVAIHPFTDGNGRVARLVMNLILMRRGIPICTIQRNDRPNYYESLSFADIGLFESLIEIILERCSDLFAEYVRIRSETKRMEEWAAKWGVKEAGVLLKRESREMELWLSRIKQVFLEFQTAADLLDDELRVISIELYDFRNEITIEKYRQLIDNGAIHQANAFSVSFRDKKTKRHERFMFRYYRNAAKFPQKETIIPLELNYFDKEQQGYIRLSDLSWAKYIRIRELYFNQEGEFMIRYFKVDKKEEVDKKHSIAEAAQWFFDDILKNMFNLSETS